MTDDDTRRRVRGVLDTLLGIPVESITGSERLDELAALDSLSLAELASALDREFTVVVPGEELTTSLLVAELEAIVAAARRATGAGNGR
jgi:acyl carrier protein